MSEKTWKPRPANMMSFPRFEAEVVVAREAMAPPTAWSTREMRSQVQKTSV